MSTAKVDARFVRPLSAADMKEGWVLATLASMQYQERALSAEAVAHAMLARAHQAEAMVQSSMAERANLTEALRRERAEKADMVHRVTTLERQNDELAAMLRRVSAQVGAGRLPNPASSNPVSHSRAAAVDFMRGRTHALAAQSPAALPPTRPHISAPPAAVAIVPGSWPYGLN